MELSNSNIKNNPYTLGNGNPKNIPYVFSREICCYISENGNIKNLFIFEETELFLYLRNRNPKKLLVF